MKASYIITVAVSATAGFALGQLLRPRKRSHQPAPSAGSQGQAPALPKSVTQKISNMQSLQSEHFAVLEPFMLRSSPKEEDFIPAALAAVALNRSLRTLRGYVWMLRQRNLMCASALIRFQIDTAMRVNALHLTDNPKQLLKRIRSGEPLSRMKSSVHPKKRLTDAYLHEQLSTRYAWVSKLYSDTSGYVHLSKPHADTALAGPDGLGMVVSISLDDDPTESDMLESMELFAKSTELIFDVCRSL